MSPPSRSVFDRRSFLGGAVCGVALAAGTSLLYGLGARGAGTLRPDSLFLTWQRDPTTTMTVQWVATDADNSSSTIHYARLNDELWKSALPLQSPFPMTDLRVFRAELTQLTPGTEYQFQIGAAPLLYRFRTMPAKATDEFQFISGGDCGANEHTIANNIIAAKQDPMFAVIGGDLAYDNGVRPHVCLQFVRNYSRHMIDSDGRLIPMVVCIGNHDVANGFNCRRSEGPFFFALHGGLYAERSFATLDFGDYLSLVLLDTGHVAPIAGEQTAWLDRTLAERTDRPHVVVVNHVPAYPSFRTPQADVEHPGTGQGNREHWVPLFDKHNVNLVLEHHDHTFKRTRPLRDGHVDPRGIVYLGDGSWGRLRAPHSPEQRSYLALTHQQYHLTLHRLEGERAFHMALSESGNVMDVSTTTKRAQV